MDEIHKILLKHFKEWPTSPYQYTLITKTRFPSRSVEFSVENMVLVHESLPNGAVYINGQTELSKLGSLLSLLEKEANCG